MGLEIKKQDRETSQALIRRFTKGVQQSGILRRARDIQFFHKAKSQKVKKAAALRREVMKKEYKKLEKLGKLDFKKKSGFRR